MTDLSPPPSVLNTPGTHIICVMENNAISRCDPADTFPEAMRFRPRTFGTGQEKRTEQVPVATIKVFFVDERGEPTPKDKAAKILIHDYDASGVLLHTNTMVKKSDAP